MNKYRIHTDNLIKAKFTYKLGILDNFDYYQRIISIYLKKKCNPIEHHLYKYPLDRCNHFKVIFSHIIPSICRKFFQKHHNLKRRESINLISYHRMSLMGIAISSNLIAIFNSYIITYLASNKAFERTKSSLRLTWLIKKSLTNTINK